MTLLTNNLLQICIHPSDRTFKQKGMRGGSRICILRGAIVLLLWLTCSFSCIAC